VAPAGDSGSVARLAWEMELHRPMLRSAARFGRPVMEWGHDWVVANGVEQFRRRGLGVETTYDRDHDPDPDRGAGAA
jgi:hypothetical protein